MYILEAATRDVLWKNVFLEISQNSQENTCSRVSFNKVAGLRSATLIKKRFWHRCFPVNFAEFLRTHFLQNTSAWLLSYLVTSLFDDFIKKLQRDLKSTFSGLGLIYFYSNDNQQKIPDKMKKTAKYFLHKIDHILSQSGSYLPQWHVA